MSKISGENLSRSTYYIILVIAMAGFATIYPLLRMLGAEISSINIAFFRAFFGLLILYPVCRISGERCLVDKKHYLPLLALGIFDVAFPTLFISFGVKNATLIHSSILVNTSPLLIALFAPLLIKEKTSWKKISGVCLGFLGVVLVILNGNSFLSLWKTEFMTGILFLLLVAVSVSVYTIFIKKYLKYYSGLTVTLYAMFSSSVFLFSMSVLTGDVFEIVHFSSETILYLILIACISTVVPKTIFTISIKQIGSTSAGSFKLLVPLFATLFAVLFFDESLSVWIVSGMILVSFGVYLVQKFSIGKKDVVEELI